MNRRIIGNIILFLFLVCVTGCSHIGEYVEMSKDGTVSAQYLDTLKKWTRDKTAYSEFETRVHISATQKSRDFNKAYRAEYARIYVLNDQEKESSEKLLAGQESQYTEFLFYAYIPDRESNDFSKENSIWKVFFVNKRGERLEPVDIRRIKEVTPVVRELFPYVNPHYGNFYSISFPQEGSSSETSEECRLIFTGVLGRVELVW